MKKKSNIRLFVAAAFCAISLIALGGCAATSDPAAEAQAANRNYMSQSSVIMDDLQANMQSFSDAVSANDIVGMKAQAEKAYKTIDHFKSLTPPDSLKDLQSEYLKGCESLKTALNDYLDLYAKINDDKAKEEASVKQDSSSANEGTAEGNESAGSDSAATKKPESSDFAAYEKQLKEIQDTYDEGITALEAADKKATEM